MKTQDIQLTARDFLPRVEALIDTLGVHREKLSVRVNRCEGAQGEQRDDLYHVWVGLQGYAPGHDIAAILDAAHDRWRDAGWIITRHRRLANGGINIAATDPTTGNSYALDSGFEKDLASYVVGFFNTPCFINPDGKAAFGPLALPPSAVPLIH